MKSIINYILIIFYLTTLFCCKKYTKCEEPLQVEQSFLLLSFINNNGIYIHSEINPLFSKDSLKIKDESGNFYTLYPQTNLIPNTSLGYWEYDLGPIYNPNTDASSFDNTLCKNFIVFYNSNITDTIKTCFKSLKTKCGSVFSNLKVYNNGQLISEVNNTIATKCLITKN